MGTRNLTLVWYKGKWYIAQYGQWDGQPSGQGVSIFHFLTNTEPDRDTDSDPEDSQATPNHDRAPPKDNITALKAAFDKDILYTPTDEECARFDAQVQEVEREARLLESQAKDSSLDSEEAFKKLRAIRKMMYSPMMTVVPSLSRDLGAKILGLVAYSKDKVPIVLDPDFIIDTLFCEWAYVVDLDENVLEIYSGATTENGGRFENHPDVRDATHGPHMLVKYTFEELTGMDAKGFVETVNALEAVARDDWNDNECLEEEHEEFPPNATGSSTDGSTKQRADQEQ